MIHFTKHAKDKFKILARHGVFINEEKIEDNLKTIITFYPGRIQQYV